MQCAVIDIGSNSIGRYFFSESLTRLLGADSEIFKMTQTYLNVLLLLHQLFFSIAYWSVSCGMMEILDLPCLQC